MMRIAKRVKEIVEEAANQRPKVEARIGMILEVRITMPMPPLEPAPNNMIPVSRVVRLNKEED